MYLDNEERKTSFNTTRETWFVYKEKRATLLSWTDEFDALAKAFGGSSCSNLGASAANIKIELIARANHCTYLQNGVNAFLIGLRDAGTTIRNLDEQVAELLSTIASQFKMGELQTVLRTQYKNIKPTNYYSGYTGGSTGVLGGNGAGVYANGANYCGTKNEAFVPLDTLITDGQSDFYWGGGTDHQGEITAPSVETQKYLYELSQATGFDYPLLLGLWCSESGAKEYSGGSGGTMGLTNSVTWDVINNKGYSYKGVWYDCPNNYKEQIDAVVKQTYRNTYGKDPDPSIMTKGNVYYDTAVSICTLEYLQNDYHTGGSNNNSSASASLHMYAQTKKKGYNNGEPFYYGRAAQYAAAIRQNMGWQLVDYENSMTSVDTRSTYTQEIQWV